MVISIMVGLKLSFIYLFLLLTNSVYAQNLDNSIYLKNLQLQRKLFLQAENELKNHKNIKACESVIQKYSYNLSNYPLFPYLKFMALQQSINEISLSQLKNFISNYNDMPLISQLKNSWLIHAAKQQKWQNFLEIYQDNKDNVELECYFIQSQYRSNQDLIKFDEAIKKIWLNGNCLPKSCDVVFEQWKQQGLMTKPMIWQRIKLAINNNNIALARFLANNHLPKIEHPIVELWIKVDNNPWLIIKKTILLILIIRQFLKF
jgi:soluble lytic murein transglycosylase